MKLTLAAVAFLLLAACGETDTDRLERQYAMIERAGASKDELCQKAREIEQAYLEAGDEREYQLKKLGADADCIEAQLERMRLRS